MPEFKFVNHIHSNQGGLWKKSDTTILVEMQKGYHEWIEIEINDAFVYRILDENKIRISRNLLDKLVKAKAPSVFVSKSDAKTHSIINKILHCDFDGFMRDCYRTSKALELVLEEFGRHGAVAAHTEKSFGNTRQIRHAVDLLRTNFSSPLTVAEVAKEVGLSESSLKRAFKKTHGTSIFSFFQSLRLEYAKELLKKRSVNITEVAYSVGYSDIAHFSRAFKRHFGVPPRGIR